ncbi:MAG: hypothetical protein MI919_04890, partial [Holophagales bacterium]|nr:hypothetical protein [Holophagales bacterium]
MGLPTPPLLLSLLGSAALAVLCAFPCASQDTPDHTAENSRPLEREVSDMGSEREGRDAYFLDRRRHEDPSVAHDPAAARLAAIRALRADRKADGIGMAGADAIQWLEIGPAPTTDGQTPATEPRFPSNVSGRINAIAIAPNSGTVYVGAAQGGLWKTNDLGVSWTPIAQDLESLSVGSLEIDPSNENTLYLGTGE